MLLVDHFQVSEDYQIFTDFLLSTSCKLVLKYSKWILKDLILEGDTPACNIDTHL